STMGPMIKVPPRNSTSTRTIEIPSKENASVVVPMIVAMHSPDKKINRLGNGILTPKNLRRPAYFHHPAADMMRNIVITVANTEAGSSSGPGTDLLSLESSPFETAFVRALYGV